MNVVGIIPCRYNSSRFPGKSLALIAGKPMMWHVYQRCLESKVLDYIYIATDDIRIEAKAKRLGMPVIMTQKNHLTGTDRVAEAALSIQADYFVNIQGDEPLINPDAIRSVVEEIVNCDNSSLICATNAYTTLDSVNYINDLDDLNIVKVQIEYESCSALNYFRDVKSLATTTKNIYYKQLGLYAFRREGLELFSQLEPRYREINEKVEMYRLLENGVSVRMVKVESDSLSVDTEEDLLRVRKIFNEREYDK